MFLHSGAGLHGHEYSVGRSPSSPQPAPPRPRRHLLVRSALRPLSDSTLSSSSAVFVRRSQSALSPPADDQHSKPSPSASTYGSGLLSSPSSSRLPHTAKRSSAPGLPGIPPRPKSEHISRPRVSVRFTDHVMVMDGSSESEDEQELPEASAESLADSVDYTSLDCSSNGSAPSILADNQTPSISPATATSTAARRSQRTSTKYMLAQPAPCLATKQRRLVRIRPRLLLQLHRITDTRPKPAFDALPSSLVSGSAVALRVARKFPRLLRLAPGLGLDDIILVRSEDYDAPDSATDDASGDDLDRRELLGIVSPVPPAAAGCAIEVMVEIALENDFIWTGFPLPNGSYEFTRLDESGNKVATARWVKKAVRGGASGPPSLMEFKYVFSILDPTSRRHPILATLTSTHLEINDSYAALPPSNAQGAPSETVERDMLTVDDDTRTLITASAVWITMRTQFSWPTPHAGAAACRSVGSPSPTTLGDRASSAYPLAEIARSGRRPSLDERTLSMALAPARVGSMDAVVSTATAVKSSLTWLPKRAVSTGAAFMRRRRAAAMAGSATSSVLKHTLSGEVVDTALVWSEAAVTASMGATESENMDAGVNEEPVKPVLAAAATTTITPRTITRRTRTTRPRTTESAASSIEGANGGFRGKLREWRSQLAQRIRAP